MQNDDVIEMIEPTPEPKRRRCRLLVTLIAALLSYGGCFIALGVWMMYGVLYGVAGFLIGYLVMGIVRAKLRNGTIPRSQQEYHYTDRAIAAWYVDREMLCR
jgi:hypothetical protein